MMHENRIQTVSYTHLDVYKRQFKKFGQRGTNIPVPTDIATHAQYNLVSVSGEQVRSIYADAFDVN